MSKKKTKFKYDGPARFNKHDPAPPVKLKRLAEKLTIHHNSKLKIK